MDFARFGSIVLAATLVTLPAYPQRPSPGRTDTAAAAAPRPLSESLTGAARADYEAARMLYEEGDFKGAAAKLQQAYERSRDPRLLWNMAACEKNLRRYSRVRALVEQYLREGGSFLTPQNRSSAAELLDAIRNFVSVLKLDANEPGATVWIDEQKLAVTPLTAPLPIDVGEHRVRVSKPGFRDFAQTLTVAGGNEIPLSVALQPVASRLVVIANEGHVIAVDGKVVGSGRWESTLRPGVHAVRVTATGMKPFEAQVDMQPEATRTLQVTLEQTGKPIWPWIAAGAAVAVGGAVGGYFLFKPKDQEGSTPTGKLNTIQMPLFGGR